MIGSTKRHNKKAYNIVGGVSKGELRKTWAGGRFEESLIENFPKLMKDIKAQIHETLWILIRRNAKKITPKYIIVKLAKTKAKNISKPIREKIDTLSWKDL